MFVVGYLREVFHAAWTSWANGVVLVLALGPAALAVVYRLFPNAPRNLDDPLLYGSIAWAVLLLLVIVPARLSQRQQAKIAELEAKPSGVEGPGFFAGATLYHSPITFYLDDGQHRVSAGSNTVVRTREFDLVAFQPGSVTVTPEPARLTLTTFPPTVSVDPAPNPEVPRSPRKSKRGESDPPPSPG